MSSTVRKLFICQHLETGSSVVSHCFDHWQSHLLHFHFPLQPFSDVLLCFPHRALHTTRCLMYFHAQVTITCKLQLQKYVMGIIPPSYHLDDIPASMVLFLPFESLH